MSDPLVFEEIEPGKYNIRFSTPILKDLLARGVTPEQIKAYLEDVLSTAVSHALEFTSPIETKIKENN
jgi:hypothetical protein